MNSLYHLKGLEYSYQWNKQEVPVLKGIDLNIEEASFACLQGPSGTGKTTLLNLLGLLDSPARGQIYLHGQDVGNLPEREKEDLRLRKIGFVFQAFYLIPTLTILENTAYFLPQLGHTQAQAQKVALDTLALVGLAEHKSKKPQELSGEQRQRVAIARALAKNPAVIIADEPTANLDADTATKIIEVFQKLQSTQRTSFIFSTHDPHLVSYAKKVYHMKDGVVL